MSGSTRRLAKVWCGLMALTALGGLASELAPYLRHATASAIALFALYKCRLVLAHYLGLRTAPDALAALTVSIALILAVVVLAIAATPFLAAIRA